MRKIIYILGLALIMTGCSSDVTTVEEKIAIEEKVVIVGDNGKTLQEKVDPIVKDDEKAIYIDDDMKEIIKDINNLRVKYEDSFDGDMYEYDYDYLYVDINDPEASDVTFTNEMFITKDYFNELVEILDTSIAKGLKEHIEEMKTKEIKDNEIILRKIGRTVIYTENRGQDWDNYISIKISFSDLRDKDYKEAFDEISQDKYILGNIVMGDKQNMIDFSNPSSTYDLYHQNKDYLNIRYNMFLGEKDIEKVNILMEGINGTTVRDDDMDVFTNLLNRLEINGEDRELLLKTYKDIFKTKFNKEIALENYKVLINSTKGGFNLGSDKKLVYFSIEKLKVSEL